MRFSPRFLLSALSGVPFGMLYGLLARLAFASNGRWDTLFSTMTLGFLCLVPFAVGALTVYLAPASMRHAASYAILMPWLSTLLWVLAAGVLGWEASICIVMALPLLLAMASVGGLLIYALRRPRGESATPTSPTSSTLALLLILLLPFGVTPLELQRPLAESVRRVDTFIDIQASEAAVWQTIVSVPEIQPHEQHASLFHLLGLPRPLAALVSHEGVGGVRQATFEGGLTFVETVDVWEPQERLGFSIRVNNGAILPAPLSQIGGQYLDILRGSYRMEPLGDGQIRLHLSSEHRLTTRFNQYGGFWTDWIMRDLQGYILRILKARAEHASAPDG